MDASDRTDGAHEDVQAWAHGLDEVAAPIGRHFARREAQERALAHIRALLSPVERTNAWQLAAIARRSACSSKAVRRWLDRYVAKGIGHDERYAGVDGDTGRIAP